MFGYVITMDQLSVPVCQSEEAVTVDGSRDLEGTWQLDPEETVCPTSSVHHDVFHLIWLPRGIRRYGASHQPPSTCSCGSREAYIK